tara:strand:- start:3025 stop:3765 length:741 start_codon:yes stop_codon:yes gene_type:complete
MKPKVSIIIPCYNAEELVGDSISSALNQTYENIEVIAVDNESTDATREAIQNIKHEKLKTFSAENIYPFCWDEARTKGFEEASGEYFFTLASDDIMSSNYIANCMKFILAGKGKIKAFQSNVKGFQGDITNITNEVKNSYKSLEEFKEISLERCPVSSPAVVYHRCLFEDGLLHTFPEKYSGAADYDLVCRLADSGVFIYPANRWLGYYYRWHPGQATWDMHKSEINYDKLIQEYWRTTWSLKSEY